jgi:hypothetical protein
VNEEASSPFLDTAGERVLVQCAVLYLDILGVRSLSGGTAAQKELHRFEQALGKSFPFDLGSSSADLGTESVLPAAVFSDSFVAVAPVQEELEQARADAIANLVFEAAQIQANLILANYFVRGAITLGQCHFHRGVLFGPALVEAVNLEQREAVNPRIILSPDAIESLRHERSERVEREALLVDEDGLVFVSYLQSIYDDPTASKPVNLAKHARVLIKNLAQNLNKMHRWRKYRWAVEYHDDFVRRHKRELEESGVNLAKMQIDLVGEGRRFRTVQPRKS